MMNLTLSFILIYFIYCAKCQNISQIMQEDKMITQFTQLLMKGDYLNNPIITILAPSDTALNQSNLFSSFNDKMIEAHIFSSTYSLSQLPGLTTNWKTYKLVKGDMEYYTVPTLKQVNQLFLYGTGPFYCNEAKLLRHDITSGTQVYHIIDRVLTNYVISNFQSYLDPKYSTTLKFWNLLNKAAENGQISGDFHYQPTLLEFSETNPATVLVPTNEAWNGVDKQVLENLEKDPKVLAMVMNRFYIRGKLLFLRNESVEFDFGFKTLSDNPKGSISQYLKVNIKSFTANIVSQNIPFKYGCIHIIDNAMVNELSIMDYLKEKNKVFVSKVSKYPLLVPYLSGNYTILAVDDETLNNITDENYLQKVLLNSFIPGNVQIGTGRYLTVGNQTIRLRITNGTFYIDTLYSSDENTWNHVASVLSLNDKVEQTSITRIKGIVSDLPMNCSELFLSMHNNLYQSSVINNGITLDVGSPYTLFVPSDSAMNNFFNQTPYDKQKSDEVRYVLQRMIIANRLVLTKKTTGGFRAATMNYAAMKELISLKIISNNCTISSYDVSQTFNFTDGGFYCNSNKESQETRLNLIYPVDFVLITDLKGISICVTSPCSFAENIGITIKLLIFTSFVVLWEFGL